jgi:nitrous oxidase accessory protein
MLSVLGAMLGAALTIAGGAPAAAAGPGAEARTSVQALVTGAEGPVVRVPAGVYRGPLVIDRPLEVVADGVVVIDGGGGGDVVRIEAPDVTVRGFTIRNTGNSLDRENAGLTVLAPRARILENTLEDVLFGVYLKKAPESVIRGNVIGGKALDVARRGDGIRLWYSPGTIVEDNVVRDSRDVVMWFSAGVHVRRNRISHGRYGLHFMYSDDNVLEDNRLEYNSVGAFLMYSRNLVLRRNVCAHNRGPSGYGIGLKDMDGIEATGNVFASNRVGVYLDNSPWSIDVFDDFVGNVVAYNDIGLAFMPSVQRNRFRDNAFIENVQQVAVLGGGRFRGNEFTVADRGNFWSDYRGYDLDGDGFGDLPYRAESLFGDLMDREPKLRLFLYSPAQQAVEMAARAFPVVRPEPKFSDEAPLMQRTAAAVPWRPPPSPWPMRVAAVTLLAAAAAVLAAGRMPARPRLAWRGGST